MTIDRLSRKSVLISLKKEDMSELSISIEKLNLKDSSCKNALKNLLALALEKTGIKKGNQTTMIEAWPHKDGCLILVTIDYPKPPRKTYKVKRPPSSPCFCFSDAENLLASIEKLRIPTAHITSNSLWLYKDRYYIIFDFSCISAKVISILGEYSRYFYIPLHQKAKITESGKKLSAKNAIREIREFLVQ